MYQNVESNINNAPETMSLLIITTLLSFLSACTSILTKPIVKWLNKPTSKEHSLHQEITELQNEQAKLSIVDDFAAHAKLQRKINGIKMELSNTTSDRVGQKYLNQFSVTIGTRMLIGLIMFYIFLYYRRSPVYFFPKNFNFYPLNYMVSYPCDIPGSVSVHFWLIVCNCVARKIMK